VAPYARYEACVTLRVLGLAFSRIDGGGRARTSDARYEFHVRSAARDELALPDSLFAARGDVVFADLAASDRVAAALNHTRAPADAVRSVDLFAMGLAHEALHAVVAVYRAHRAPGLLVDLVARLRADLGERLDATLLAFLGEFPPPSVYRGEVTPGAYLAGSQGGVSNVEWALEEILLLSLTNENRAFAPIHALVSDDALRRTTGYEAIVAAAERVLDDAPTMGPRGETLLTFMRAPMRHAPESIAGQIDYMREHWGLELEPLAAWGRLLLASDVYAEEARWIPRAGAPFAYAPSAEPATFTGPGYDAEPERFSSDRDWMPRVVMIAKSTFVWLDQLAKRYGRPITTLSDVPEEELETLSRRGFTALWLIGVWERSFASRAIKQRQGNRDALASAYSLDGYEIAGELGGYDAYVVLCDRARRHGIRLASDMVPNHMGIDSQWVVDHPDWFVQSREPPYPGYTFDGPDLSDDSRVGIFLEDGYWSHRDAAVVFKRLDRWTGDARFVYHGNDGTSMPWNDTAQLDYLRDDVREAVIKTILHVARRFPIIRFDAAMTLARRHFQRLWFPLPGSGGDCVPSRARHAMTKHDFDRAFPVEFWREVVDRVAVEAPDTLLLAEAFWMMEGYFVRTLGMHRVYNSAFMNMLKREENAAYRTSIKNVLEFDPRILERHVNFMNNPDEETAVAQFGRDDKYFGVATVMSTMPGLPMFGHGQIEGFGEKYGMEYRRAMRDERPDGVLVERHEREIFPLLRMRALFSGVEGFTLYDFVAPEGHVDEDVIAYSNGSGEARVLVVFHNKYKETRGTLATSAPFKGRDGTMQQRSLSSALNLEGGGLFVCRDEVTGLEHLVDASRIEQMGLSLALRAFEYLVWTRFTKAASTEDVPYDALARELQGRGVPSVEGAARSLRFRAIHQSLWHALEPGSVKSLLEERTLSLVELAVREKVEHLIEGVRHVFGPVDVPDDLADVAVDAMTDARARRLAPPWSSAGVAYVVLSTLAELQKLTSTDVDEDAWRVDSVVARALREGGAAWPERDAAILRFVAGCVGATAGVIFEKAFGSIPRPLGVNDYEGTRWFHQESAEHLVLLLEAIGVASSEEGDALRTTIAASECRVAGIVPTRPFAPKPVVSRPADRSA
jgi:glycosidase